MMWDATNPLDVQFDRERVRTRPSRRGGGPTASRDSGRRQEGQRTAQETHPNGKFRIERVSAQRAGGLDR
ncbi:hypothetical protein [Natrarchaeobius oligotrophus]|nr:hypothetical protein [Natrarchaeobius chitinivorans]